MTASTEPRGGLDLGWSSGEDGWGDAMNANLLRLSRLGFHPSVLSATTTAPPGSPISGSGYIIPSGATGAWAGKTGQVAVWDGVAWAYAAPRDGWTMHVDGAGLTTYDGGAWSQANVATAAGVGAEPYAGAPAQASFWRSTAAGVRAWVQLVASDITDLATTLAGYLTKLNPTYTGRLTGPTQYLEADEQILLAIRRPGGQSGRIHGVAFQAQNDASAWVEFGRAMTYISSVTAGAHTGGMRLMAYKAGAIVQALEAGPDGVRVGANLPLQMGTTTVVDSSRNITGATLKGSNLTGAWNRPLVAGADGTIDDQDAATFRGTIGALAVADPNFTGNLLQDGDQRITPSGGGRFTDLSLTTLAAGSNMPVVSDAAGVIRNKTAEEFRTIIAAAASAGVTDGSDAASGVVGQYYEALLPEASFVYAANGSPVAVLSLSLPAGDWLVEGRATAHITGAMNGNKVVSGLNTSIAIPTDGTEVYGGLQVFSATNGFQTMTGSKRFSLTATTTVYLVARIDFSAGTPALFGCMSARRMR